jgi:hypothetical protein
MRFCSNVWRIACATARRMLIDAAAPMWSVASSLCTAAHGAVTHNGNTLTYGQLATTNFRIVSQPMLPSAY